MASKAELFKVSEPKWKKAFSRTQWIMSSFVAQSRHYSFIFACYGLIWWIGIYGHCPYLSRWAMKHLTKWLDDYLEKHYDDIIAKYASDESIGDIVSVEDYPIWLFWWQGVEAMPQIVRSCYNRIKANNKNVFLLTKENISQFADIPDEIYEKVKRGNLSYTHFSDILRLTLLAEKGGMWIDVTCFNPYEIPAEAKQMVFCSPHDNLKQSQIKDRYSYFSDSGGWRSWNLGTCMKHNYIFMFCRDMVQALTVNEKCLPNYFLVDFIMCYAYRKIPGAKKTIDMMPDINTRCADLFLNYFNKNRIYDEKEYNELIKDNWLFKLTYKTIWKKKIDGKYTFFGKLLADLA